MRVLDREGGQANRDIRPGGNCRPWKPSGATLISAIAGSDLAACAQQHTPGDMPKLTKTCTLMLALTI
jgi:hypothetical protein